MPGFDEGNGSTRPCSASQTRSSRPRRAKSSSRPTPRTSRSRFEAPRSSPMARGRILEQLALALPGAFLVLRNVCRCQVAPQPEEARRAHATHHRCHGQVRRVNMRYLFSKRIESSVDLPV
eukprot:2779039-Rhodomonas_salina.1